MDYEDFLINIYTPLRAIEIITDIIYTKCNEDWEIFDNKLKRKDSEELLALNFAINICAKYLLNKRAKTLESTY